MNYYFHKRPVGNVSLFFYTKGERCELSTGVKVDDGTLHRTRGYLDESDESEQVNKVLFGCLKKASDLVVLFKNANDNNEPNAKELKRIYNMKGHSVPTFKDMISVYGKDMVDGNILKSNGHVLSEFTKRNAVSVVKNLILKLTDDILSEKMGTTIVGTHERARMFAGRIIKRLSKFNYEDKSIADYLRHVRDSMRWYDAKFGTSISLCKSSIKIGLKSKEVSLITKEESDYIINGFDAIRAGCENENEKGALDLWVCALFLGQRLADMQSWTTDNLYNKKNGNTWIKFRQSKTDEEMDLPVFPKLVEIFNRNASLFGGRLMPSINNVSLHMKSIAKRLEIFDYDYQREVYIGGKRSYKAGKRWEFIHIHEMRGTCITNMLESGVDELVVKAFSGHTVNSRAFSRYVKVRDDVKSRAMDMMIQNVACDNHEKQTKVIGL